MSRLVASLDVQVDEVVGAQGVQCGGSLPLVVGVIESRRPLDLDVAQPGVAPDAAYQVDRRNHRPAFHLGEAFGQRLHLRTVAGRPGPDAVCRVLAFGCATPVQRMGGEQLLRLQYQRVEQVGGVLRFGHFRLDEQRTEGLQGYIVRGCAADALVPAAHDEQVAVLHAGVEVHTVVAQVRLKVFDEFRRLSGGDVSGGVVLQQVAVDADKVAAHRHVARLQVDAHAGSFQHAASLVDSVQVVSQDGHVCHFASGMEAFGYGCQASATSVAGQPVHVRRVCILQQRAVPELFHGPVRHAVS